jgi:hypothetical protein
LVRISTSGVLYLNALLAGQLDHARGYRFAVEVDVVNNQVRLVPAPDGYQAQRQQGKALQVRCKEVVRLLPPAALDKAHPASVTTGGTVVVEVAA